MATFTVSGVRNGKPASITWTDGVLSGDPDAVAGLRMIANLLEGTRQGQIGGPYTTHHHLRSPYTARALMLAIFSERATMTGTLPPLPEPPEGGIQ